MGGIHYYYNLLKLTCYLECLSLLIMPSSRDCRESIFNRLKQYEKELAVSFTLDTT